MTEHQEYAIRDEIPFGEGTFSSVLTEDHSIEDLRQRALILGWSHGCPIALELTDPKNPEYGPVTMMRRYAEVNRWFQIIIKQGEEVNPKLTQTLVSAKQRLTPEPVGKYEVLSVPTFHLAQMAPMATPYGYALPRVVIEMLRQGPIETNTEVIALVRKNLVISQTPYELLARMSQTVITRHANPLAVLSHCLSPGILQEENCGSIFNKIGKALSIYAPDLWRDYTGLSNEEKSTADILNIS